MPQKLKYDNFEWFASISFDCPLCGTHVPPGVRHQCSDGKPVVDVTANSMTVTEVSVTGAESSPKRRRH